MEGKGKGDGRRDGPLRLSTCATGRTRSTAQVDFRPDRATASRSMAHGRFLSAVAVAPAVARLKGMAETLDLVDFGVAVLKEEVARSTSPIAPSRKDSDTERSSQYVATRGTGRNNPRGGISGEAGRCTVDDPAIEPLFV